MNAEYVQLNGQYVSKGFAESVRKGKRTDILCPDPHARVRAEKPKPDKRGKGENSGVEAMPARIGYSITFIFRRRNLLDGHDNLRASAKALVDDITKRLGFNSDSDPLLSWEYLQIKSRARSTTVLIETTTTTTERPQ